MRKIESTNVSNPLKNTAVLGQTEASTTHPTQIATLGLSIPDIIHTDIYVEVVREGLAGEGKVHSLHRPIWRSSPWRADS